VAITLYQGGRFDDRTLAMYHEVERLTPFQVFVSQGGFNTGGVAASAGTHDRAAVDVSGSILTSDERWQVVTNMRRVGFAAWIRTPAQGFPWHMHGVPINGDLSTAARAQVVQYSQHKNGLAGGGPDDGPAGFYDRTWEKYTGSSAYRPPINTGGGTTQQEDDMTPGEHEMLQDAQFKANGAWAQATDANKRIQDLQALVASIQTAVQNIQFTSNAAYANAGQTLAELREFVAYEQADDKATMAALKPYVDGPEAPADSPASH
jgi:hypothetical protein